GRGGYYLPGPGELLLRFQRLQHPALALHAGGPAAWGDQGSLERDGVRPQPDRQAGPGLGHQLLAGSERVIDHSAAHYRAQGDAQVLSPLLRDAAAGATTPVAA